MNTFGDDGSDDEYAGTAKRKAGGSGRGGHGSDDDLWSELAGKGGAASVRSTGSSRDRAINPFMIQSAQVSPKSTSAAGVVDSIPIDSLSAGVDASIFKDFGADPKKRKGKGGAEPVAGASRGDR